MTPNLADAADYVISMFDHFGVSVAESSRLGQMRSTLAQEKLVQPSDRRFKARCEAVRNIRALEYVFDHLQEDAVRNPLRRKLLKVVGDPIAPEAAIQSRKRPPDGRNYQHELLVAATCAKAGLRPQFKEPDIQIVLRNSDARLGIAAKRSTSLTNIVKLFGSACEQIAQAGLPGVVALDASLAFDPSNPLVNTSSDEAFRHIANTSRRFFDDKFDRLMEKRGKREVLGILLIRHFVNFDPSKGFEWLSHTEFACLQPHNARRRKLFAEFEKAYKSSLPEPLF